MTCLEIAQLTPDDTSLRFALSAIPTYRVNCRLGYDHEAWITMAAASMQAEDDDPEGGARH